MLSHYSISAQNEHILIKLHYSGTFALMKFFIFIMALTVLACSVIPCREVAFSVTGHEQSKILKTSSHQEHSDGDSCSPFCSCNCCCGITFMFTGYQAVKPLERFLQIRVFHLPSKITDNSLPVWQPPQLV